jgi:hypothetical protein
MRSGNYILAARGSDGPVAPRVGPPFKWHVSVKKGFEGLGFNRRGRLAKPPGRRPGLAALAGR